MLSRVLGNEQFVQRIEHEMVISQTQPPHLNLASGSPRSYGCIGPHSHHLITLNCPISVGGMLSHK